MPRCSSPLAPAHKSDTRFSTGIALIFPVSEWGGNEVVMNLSFFYCLMGMVGISGIYLLLGVSAKKKGDPTGLNLVTCCVGVGLSVSVACPIHAAAFPRAALLMGSLIGSAAVFGFVGSIMALRAGVAVSVVNTIMNLSMVVPVVLSMFFYHEVPHMGTVAGIILAGVSVYLLQGRKS